jgi:flagellar biosynthetic protein FlhB
MDESEQNKSEEPTQFKLMRSRRKGMVARGMDLGFLTGLAAFSFYAWIAAPGLAQSIARLAGETFVTAPQVANGPEGLLGVTAIVFGRMLRPLAFLCGTLFLVVLLFEMAQTGLVFSASPLKPDFGRLNPANGLKRLFTVKMLIETLKNILKLGAYGTVAWIIIAGAIRNGAATADDARSLLASLASASFRLLAAFVGVALAFALLDQLLSRRLFLKQMRMSRRELRREHRDREGEPRIKQRRKQLHGQFAKASQGLRDVRGADVVITNPTRIAVALKYDRGTMDAPAIVAKGAEDFAARIRHVAFTHNVVIVEDKPLARDLFRRCATGSAIPEDCYRRVASIYRKLPAHAARTGDVNV